MGEINADMNDGHDDENSNAAMSDDLSDEESNVVVSDTDDDRSRDASESEDDSFLDPDFIPETDSEKESDTELSSIFGEHEVQDIQVKRNNCVLNYTTLLVS